MPESREIRVGDRVRVMRSTINPAANGREGVVVELIGSPRGRDEVIVEGDRMSGPWYVESLDIIESTPDEEGAAPVAPRRPIVGDSIRITQDEFGAPVGETRTVVIVEEDRVRYLSPAALRAGSIPSARNTFYSRDGSYDLIVPDPRGTRALIEEKLTAYRQAPGLAPKVVVEELEWVLTLLL